MLSRLWSKFLQRRRRRGYHSAFGGLWTDRTDAAERLHAKEARGTLDAEDARALRHWMERGYWIVPGAVSHEAIERMGRAADGLWDARGRDVLVEIAGAVRPYRPELRGEHCKLVDLYAISAPALELALSAPVQRFLRLVFEGAPTLFQSLSFERGSEQPPHQDTAYVPVVPPLAFAAAWVALEDIRPGSGELAYYPGSHRMGEFLFGGQRNWNRERDGLDAQRRYHEWLLAETSARGLARETFRPKKGDVLFWSADLAHGGSPIEDRALSRKSFVCHYCAADARPYYLGYSKARVETHASGAHWVSLQYPTRAARAEPAG